MKRICIYCGSNFGSRAAYRTAAEELGRLLAERNIGLVYGGGNVGLMGVVADAALAAGGEVIGVIPEALLAKEVGHRGLTELRVVPSMHERKALMAELSDAFIAMPGGFGTLEELAEVTTWTQLGIHRKPVGLLNVEGFYDGLLSFIGHAVQERFIREEHSRIIVAADTVGELVRKLEETRLPVVQKWLDREDS